MDEEGENKINITSLADVSLTLVIIFMVVAPFVMQTGIKVTSSKLGEKRSQIVQSENVTISLNQKGEIQVNGKKVLKQNLAQTLKKAIPHSRNNLVMLLASPQNKVKEVVSILDVARQQGAKHLAILKHKRRTSS